MKSNDQGTNAGIGTGRTLPEETVRRLCEEVKWRLKRKRNRRRLVPPDPPPRYDEVFFEGTAWLDLL
jgi:hypothetical protein